MSLADGIVREFRSEIISSLVPLSNPPVARNGNKRSNGAYVRHEEYEDSTLIGIRRSPLRAARTHSELDYLYDYLFYIHYEIISREIVTEIKQDKQRATFMHAPQTFCSECEVAE
ncbi:hypothetical protein ALC62_02125 [Cyphomyrmex costatus]|uniref:Uncharacterized protein n=1 Tax=Cyphomyrmex costatus TaxID=456900 RepID=A0A195D1U8_9HYME|nr:hypothetical protein ALC62_02125 [Cyphomyrmex costatus]